MSAAGKIAWRLSVASLFTLALGLAAFSASAQSPSSLHERADAAYQTGMKLLREKEYTKALDQFRLVEKYVPQLPQGYSGEGIALALMGKPEEATQALKKALEIDPSFWVARRELGIVYWHQELKEQAAKELYPIVQLFPEDAPVNVILGQYEFERQNYARATAFFAKAPAQLEGDPQLSLMNAEALLKTGEVNRAGEALKRLTGQPGLTSQQSFQLAWLLGQAKHYKQAIRIFSALPQDYPDPFARNYGLALAYFENEQHKECIDTLNALRARGITKPELFSLLGVAYEKSGHTLEAYDAFRQGIYANPKDAQNYLNIATLASEHLNYDLAVQMLSSGIERVQDAHKLILSRGIAYSLQGRLKQARADYQKALEMAPEELENYLALGLSYLEAGEADPAVQTFERATAKRLKDPRPYYFLAEALLQKGLAPETAAFRQATEALDTALSLDANFAWAYVDRAKLAMKTQQTAKAISDLERARALEPQSSTIAYLLAQAYQRDGEKAKADELFALVKESSDEEARRFRRGELTDVLVTLSSSHH